MADSTSARRRTLPARERQICARLRVIRETVGLTQQELADQLGLTRQRLASYEEQRVAIRFDVGIKLCRHLIVSEHWLATGSGEQRQHLGLGIEMVPRSVSMNALYSEVFDGHLAPFYQRRLERYPNRAIVAINPGEPRGVIEGLFYQCLGIWKARLSKDAADVLFRALITHASNALASAELIEETLAANAAGRPADEKGTIFDIPIRNLPAFNSARLEDS